MLAVWIAIAIGIVVVLAGATIVLRRRRTRALERGPASTLAAPAPTSPTRPSDRRTDEPIRAGPPLDAPTLPETGTSLTEPTAADDGAGGIGSDVATVDLPADEGSVPDLKERLGKTRGLFSGYLRAIRARASVGDDTWEELEEALLRADVGLASTTVLLTGLRERVRSGELVGPDAVVQALQEDIRGLLQDDTQGGLHFEEGATNVWLFVGVNGVGKTTTIGKVANQQVAAGRSVLLAAGDTFRAAAGEQLETWAGRAGVGLVRGADGGDPSAVVYDAVQRAAARGNDLVLADTAGRLHTKVNLVEELKKVRRVADRPPGRVTEVLLVLDATTGQNGLAQARQFTEAVGVTGVVLTKLDGSARGGIVVAIRRELGLSVKLVGVGEGPLDLVVFDPTAFVDALFA